MIFQSKVCVKTWKKPQSMYIPTTIILAEKRSTFYKNCHFWYPKNVHHIIELVYTVVVSYQVCEAIDFKSHIVLFQQN